VGMPECRINLAHGVTYLACAPKSNASYAALEAALGEVREHGAFAPPVFLRSTGYSGAKDLGHGVGYEYPHDTGGYIEQRYLPEALWDREFYQPISEGRETAIGQFLARMRALRRGGGKGGPS
jgi:putative ATPase